MLIINMYYIQMYNIYMENFLQPNLILMFLLVYCTQYPAPYCTLHHQAFLLLFLWYYDNTKIMVILRFVCIWGHSIQGALQWR